MSEYEMSEEVRILEQQLDVAAEFCRQYQTEIAQLKAENKKLGETNEQLGNYYMKINSMYWNDEIFEVNHGEGFYTDKFVEMIDDL